MKTLVTGGAGFIGSHIVERLLKDGHEVLVVDDLSAGKKENIPDGAEFINCSVLDEKVLDLYMEGVDVIFHNAASKKNICLANPKKDLDINAKGTLTMLQLAKKHGVKKFVHASTGSIYGERDITLIENLKPEPVSYYGISKMAGEMYVKFFGDMGMNTTILRYFHVFGKRQDYSQDKGGVVAIFIDKIRKGETITVYGDGRQERSFTHVSDVVEANMLAWKTKGGIYNVASGIRIDIWYLIAILSGLLDMAVNHEMAPRMEGDIDKFRISNANIRSLGLEFTDIVDGLKKTI